LVLNEIAMLGLTNHLTVEHQQLLHIWLFFIFID
jgi:hypothetical protein